MLFFAIQLEESFFVSPFGYNHMDEDIEGCRAGGRSIDTEYLRLSS